MTTFDVSLRHHPAVSGRRGRLERARRVHRAPHQARLHPHAAVGDRRVHGGHLQRGDGEALPERHRGQARPRPVIERREDAARLSREAHAGGLPESELRQEAVEAGRAERVGNLDRSDVARVGEDVGQRHRLRRMGFRVVDHRVVHAQLIRDRQPLVKPDGVLLHGRRRGDDLVHRSRLVDVGHRAVPQEVGVRLRERVRVEPWIGRHRQDLSRVRVHDDDGSAGGVVSPNGLGQGLLGAILDVPVDRQGQVVARHRRRRGAPGLRDQRAARILLHHLPAGPAGQQATGTGARGPPGPVPSTPTNPSTCGARAPAG